MPFVVEILKQHDVRALAYTTQRIRAPSANNTWTNVATWSYLLKLAKTSLVVVKSQIVGSLSQDTNVCCQNVSVRVRFVDSAGNSYPVGGYNWRTYNTTATYTFDFQGFAVLPAGTYSLYIDVNGYDIGYVKGGINDIYVGVIDLVDLFKTPNFQQTVTTDAGQRTNFGQVNIPALTTKRKTVIGPTKHAAMIFIFIGCESNLGYGDGASSNYLGFQIYLDGSWIDTPSRQSTACVECTNPLHWAQHYVLIDPTQPHTVLFRQSNGTSSSQTTTYYCGVIACPWIFPQDTYYDLIDIEVPVGSTIYGAVEDLFMPSNKKYAAVRSVNAMNGAQNVAEFTQDPGQAAPLNFNYTPEWYETEITLAVKGTWNCLSRLAADLRG